MTDMAQAVSNNAAADFLKNKSGDYLPAFKFSTVGDTVGGQITRVQIVHNTDLKGNPQQNLVVELVDGDSGWSVWISESKPKMVNAVLNACRTAGVSAPMVGDLMRVTFSGETAPTKVGYNPSKDFTANYKRGGGTPPAPVAAQPQPVTPAQPTADSLI